jgi:hypothetical protein
VLRPPIETTSFIIHYLGWQAERGFGALARNGDYTANEPTGLPARAVTSTVRELYAQVVRAFRVLRDGDISCRLLRDSKPMGVAGCFKHNSLAVHRALRAVCSAPIAWVLG